MLKYIAVLCSSSSGEIVQEDGEALNDEIHDEVINYPEVEMKWWDALRMDDESLFSDDDDSVDSDNKSEDSLVLHDHEE